MHGGSVGRTASMFIGKLHIVGGECIVGARVLIRVYSSHTRHMQNGGYLKSIVGTNGDVPFILQDKP